MESKIIIVDAPRRRRKKRGNNWKAYARLSLLSLAAMMTARLVLLAVDVAQLQVAREGIVTIPACAAVLIITGWKLREWTASRKEGKHE